LKRYTEDLLTAQFKFSMYNQTGPTLKMSNPKVICHFLLPLASSTSSSSASLLSLLSSLSMYERPDGPDTAGALVGEECSKSSLSREQAASSDSPWLPDKECLSIDDDGRIHCRKSSKGAWMQENSLRLWEIGRIISLRRRKVIDTLTGA